MIIATFNANGIRARLPILLDWIEREAPDVLCIQETKVQDPDFPEAPFKEKGYHCVYKGQKSYNGVAILSKAAPEDVKIGFRQDDATEEARLIVARIAGISIVNTYIPQGQDSASDKFQYKLNWFAELLNYLKSNFDPEAPLVWLGDFNVAPDPIDVYDPDALHGSVGYHPKEHEILQTVKKWGFIDVFRRHNPEPKQYTFWDYRIPNSAKRGLGWRIDHIWATLPLAEKSKTAWIDVEARLLPRPSDHTFLVAEFQIPSAGAPAC